MFLSHELLQAGATPLELAKKYSRHSVVDYLQNIGKRIAAITGVRTILIV